MTAQRRLVLIGALLMAIFAGGAAMAESASIPPICLLKGPVLAGKCEESRPLFELNAGFAPRALPLKDAAPIAVYLDYTSHYSDGRVGLPLQELIFELDRDMTLDAEEIAVCGRLKILGNGFADARRVCRGAIVGAGTVEVASMESTGTTSARNLPMTIYNAGSRAGVSRLLLNMRPISSVGGSLLVTAEVKPISNGVFGTEAAVKIPRIMGGSKVVVGLRLRIGRRTHAHGIDSMASARCPNKRLVLRVSPRLTDGTWIRGSTVRACTVRRRPD